MEKETLFDVLRTTYLTPYTISSDFARYKAKEIAALASMGLITTRESFCEYGRFWRVTEKGISHLRDEGSI
jgi:hypothetical protein